MGNEATKPHSELDLVEAGRNLYDFIKQVNENCTLYMEPVIKNAIQRYEQKWLPLAARHLDKTLVAPLDIEWVWYVHMMNPQAYARDSMALTRTLIDHKLPSEEEQSNQLRLTEELWNKSYPGELFSGHLTDASPPVDEEFRSSFTFDLYEAVRKESVFNYQISLPHYRDEKFLKEAVKRYDILLKLRVCYPDLPLIPYFDNDLIWHAHMAHPRKYAKESQLLFASVLNHEFSDSVRYPGTPLWSRIPEARKLWEAKGRSIAVSGGMFRGAPPFPHAKRNPDRYTSYSHKTYYLQPKALHLQNIPEGTYRIVVKCEAKQPEVTKSFIVHDDGLQSMKENWTKQFDLKNDECRFVLNTDIFYGLSVSLYKQLNSSTYESYVCTCDFPPSSVIGRKVDEFILPLCLKFSGCVNKNKNAVPSQTFPEFIGDLRLSCPEILPGHYMFQVERKSGAFQSFSNLAGLLQLPRLVIPYHIGSTELACSYQDFHVLGSLGHPAFHLRIVHCLKPKVSVVEVSDFNSELVASAHAIDNGALPSQNQISDDRRCCTLNAATHKAMLIRSENCDWGIVRASWQGYRKFVDSGHLEVELLILKADKPHWISVYNSGHLKHIFTLDFGHGHPSLMGKVVVDVEKAIVSFLGTVKHVPELLCFSACISILFALCQPRHAPPRDEDGNILPYSLRTKKSYRFNVASLAYIVDAGLYCSTLPRFYEN